MASLNIVKKPHKELRSSKTLLFKNSGRGKKGKQKVTRLRGAKMPLDEEQRIQLARAVAVELSIRQISQPADRERELLRLLVLPTVMQNQAFRTIVGNVKAFLQNQQASAASQRSAQDEAWEQDIASMTTLETGI